MELDAFERQRAVAHPHHVALGRERGRAQRVGELVDHQRVIERRQGRVRYAGEDAGTVVAHRGGLAVSGNPGAAHARAEGHTDRLVPETHAEHRHGIGRAALDHVERGARAIGSAGARRQHHARRAARGERAGGYGVVADHLHVGSERLDELDEVVGERVVVVDDEDPGPPGPGCGCCQGRARDRQARLPGRPLESLKNL